MSKIRWYQKPIYLLVALALVLSLGIVAVPMAGTVEADTINVPANYPTIQQAVDNATAGDVIIVAEGTYYESITLKSGVKVLGAGADVTTIDGSTARGGQPAYHVVVGADNATLDGFTVTGGNATGDGIDEYGGGMFNYNYTSPTVTNCIFWGNSAKFRGGGMYNGGNSSPTVANCIFSGNSTSTYGGGMANYNSSPNVTDCIFSGNSADWGGGMFNDSDSSPTVTNCSFSGNSAYSGSGMCNYGSSPAVTNCIFEGNSAIWTGGGMLNGGSSPKVTNCIFEGNSADYGGGMYNTDSSSPNVTNCIFEGNSASMHGGGMYNDDNSSPTVTDCIFEGNSADYDGGGMLNASSSPTVDKCIFEGNSATNDGGGMFNVGVGSSPNVTKCIFSGNSATNYGGGMKNLYGSSPKVTNCIFEGNSASSGGGMQNFDSSPAVTNCIFEGNSASYNGSGMHNYHSSPVLTNCILWDNGGEIYNYASSEPVVTYCDIQGGYTGVGNIDADPMFLNPAAHDYHSKPGSPCIDAGTNDGAPSDDIEGNPRPIDGDGDGIATTDMGAYEYVPPTPPAHFRYLHSTSGLFNLTAPIGTQWHELWPFFCNEYHLSSWNDTSGDGVLSYCDRIDMYQKPDGEVRWYHVEEVTITLNVTHNETGEPKYIELEGGYNASVLTAPNSTQWHEIHPNFCRQYELIGWNDTSNITGELDYCDYIELTDKWTGEKTWWHVEEVAIDIIVTIEPPPVGGEAYPVNKFAILAPWIAVMVLLAGGISWLALRRRKT